MIFVAVREHDTYDVVQAVANVAKVGQNHVDARLVLLGEQHADINDQQFAVDFEDGHVAANFANSAERNDAQSAWAEWCRIRQS